MGESISVICSLVQLNTRSWQTGKKPGHGKLLLQTHQDKLIWCPSLEPVQRMRMMEGLACKMPVLSCTVNANQMGSWLLLVSRAERCNSACRTETGTGLCTGLGHGVCRESAAHPGHLPEVGDVVVQPDELMHHGLVCPLHEQGGDRVLLAVQQKNERSCLRHCSAAKVKQLPLIHSCEMVQGLCQLLAHL